jgi:hypothetical protein
MGVVPLPSGLLVPDYWMRVNQTCRQPAALTARRICKVLQGNLQLFSPCILHRLQWAAPNGTISILDRPASLRVNRRTRFLSKAGRPFRNCSHPMDK